MRYVLFALLLAGCASQRTHAPAANPYKNANRTGVSNMQRVCSDRPDLCRAMGYESRALSGAGPFMPR